MKQQYTNIQTGISYALVGDYYLPNLTVPEERYNIGRFGMMRQNYLKTHCKSFYISLLTSGNIYAHLCEIDEAASAQMQLLCGQMSEREGVTERLKVENQMLWVQKMNNIRNRAEEIIREELIYV